jgi:hypothetical protein
MNDEFKRCSGNRSSPNLSYSSDICFQGLRNTAKHLGLLVACARFEPCSSLIQMRCVLGKIDTRLWLVSSVSNSCDVQNNNLNLSNRYCPLWKIHFIAGRSVSIVCPVSTSPTIIFRKWRISSNHFLNFQPVWPGVVFCFNPWLSVCLYRE